MSVEKKNRRRLKEPRGEVVPNGVLSALADKEKGGTNWAGNGGNKPLSPRDLRKKLAVKEAHRILFAGQNSFPITLKRH